MQNQKKQETLKQRGITSNTKGQIIGIVVQKNKVIRMTKLAAKRRRVKRI